MSDVTGPGIEPHNFCADNAVFNQHANPPWLHLYKFNNVYIILNLLHFLESSLHQTTQSSAASSQRHSTYGTAIQAKSSTNKSRNSTETQEASKQSDSIASNKDDQEVAPEVKNLIFIILASCDVTLKRLTSKGPVSAS